MSFFYICSKCNRGFTEDDLFKRGVLNKMLKPVWQGNVPQAGMYSSKPTRRCPYCLSKQITAGTEKQRSSYRKERRSYPAPDPRYPAVAAAQKYEDCEVNADIAARTITGLSGEAEQRLKEFLDDRGWKVSDTVLKELSAEFSHGVICFYPSENTWVVYRDKNIFCAIRRGATENDYLFSIDGANFTLGESTNRILLTMVDEAICDYSLMLRANN